MPDTPSPIVFSSAEFIEKDAKYQLPEIQNAVDALTRRGGGRDWVADFEAAFRTFTGASHAVAFNSGTSALHAALVAVGVGPGDEVILPALGVVMQAYCVELVGGTPVFADVARDTHLVELSELKKLVTEKTKAIITCAWDGVCCDFDEIIPFAHSKGIWVIEDSARALGCVYKGRSVACVADVTMFSFESRKHMTTGGEGGMLTCNNPDIASNARKFGGIGYKHLSADSGETYLNKSLVQDPSYHRFDAIGVNYRMTDISAAIGIAQLDRAPLILGRRKEVGKIFLEAVGECKWLVPQRTPDYCQHTYYSFVVEYIPTINTQLSWKDFYDEFCSRGGDGFYSTVMVPYLELYYRGKSTHLQDYREGLCPTAENLQKNSMCFKTNYRDMETAKRQASILSGLIQDIDG